MITTKKELKFYILADRMMNKGRFNRNLFDFVKMLIGLDKIWEYINILRHLEYYKNVVENKIISRTFTSPVVRLGYKIIKTYWTYRWLKLGQKVGFSISPNVCGYGLVIPHWGTIVVGHGNTIGNYCLLHTCVCIRAGKNNIGDFARFSIGSKISAYDATLGDGVSIAANSVITRSCEKDNVVLAGMPAKIVKESKSWVFNDGDRFVERFEKIEELKRKMFG